MKMDMNDTRTPRERVGESLLRLVQEECRENNNCPGRTHMGMTRDGRCVSECRRAMPTAAVPEAHKGNCGGQGYSGWGLNDRPLAMAYSPLQAWQDAYDPETALSRGTMFAQLDLPFVGDGARGGGCRER